MRFALAANNSSLTAESQIIKDLELNEYSYMTKGVKYRVRRIGDITVDTDGRTFLIAVRAPNTVSGFVPIVRIYEPASGPCTLFVFLNRHQIHITWGESLNVLGMYHADSSNSLRYLCIPEHGDPRKALGNGIHYLASKRLPCPQLHIGMQYTPYQAPDMLVSEVGQAEAVYGTSGKCIHLDWQIPASKIEEISRLIPHIHDEHAYIGTVVPVARSFNLHNYIQSNLLHTGGPNAVIP